MQSIEKYSLEQWALHTLNEHHIGDKLRLADDNSNLATWSSIMHAVFG